MLYEHNILVLFDFKRLQVLTVHLLAGYIGVINRSQNDINENTPIEEIREREARYFAEHKAYRFVLFW